MQLIGGPQGYRVYGTEEVDCTRTSRSGGAGTKTGLYLVGVNRKEGMTGERTTAFSLNASDFSGINQNKTQNTVFADLCTGHPKQTRQDWCVTARYGQTVFSNHTRRKIP